MLGLLLWVCLSTLNHVCDLHVLYIINWHCYSAYFSFLFLIVVLYTYTIYFLVNILVLLRGCLARCRPAMDVPTISHSCILCRSCSRYLRVHFMGKKNSSTLTSSFWVQLARIHSLNFIYKRWQTRWIDKLLHMTE